MVDDDVTHATRHEIEHIWEHIDVIEETVGITRKEDKEDDEE